MTQHLRTGILAVAVAALMGAADPADRPLEIYFIDVEGGAATLLVTPERESVLIDSGWPGQDDRDPKRIEHVLKSEAHLDHLDHLVTTHWHVDHYGGVAGLARRVKIEHFWDRGLPDLEKPDGDRAAFPDGPFSDDPLGIAYRGASKGQRKTLKAGDTLPLRGRIEAVVLTSGGDVISRPDSPANPACANVSADQPDDPSDNARSLTLRFRLGAFDFLDCGDLTWNVEKRLVCPNDKIGPIDLFQVTHHGMAISNQPTLLETIAPTIAVMNNGPRKGGDPSTLKRLQAIPTIKAVYQLHKNAATPDEANTAHDLIANPNDNDEGRFVRVIVAPDGASFRVGIGADGPTRTYPSR